MFKYAVSNIFTKNHIAGPTVKKLIDQGKVLNAKYDMSTIGQSVLAVNPDIVRAKKLHWDKHMSGITPHYAIKSFPDTEICKVFTNFDCASSNEMQKILDLGIESKKIIYANPVKRPSDIKYAASKNINVTTADSIEECKKILSIHPNCKIVLRIAADDKNASNVSFSAKFGIPNIHEGKIIVDELIKINKYALYGFSFHVGSGQENPLAYVDAVKKIDEYMEYIKSKYQDTYGSIRMIDIGGGFTPESDLEKIKSSLKHFLDKYKNLEWISEPGRYFSADSSDLYCPIISKRVRSGKTFYTLPNSIYHSFSCLVFDAIKPNKIEWIIPNSVNELVTGAISGETCDGNDIIYDGQIPNNLNEGDIMIFPKFGAYTQASGCPFNGFPLPTVEYITK
jgi:ornithine decarboxylase